MTLELIKLECTSPSDALYKVCIKLALQFYKSIEFLKKEYDLKQI